jgi:hypothetical protein
MPAETLVKAQNDKESKNHSVTSGQRLEGGGKKGGMNDVQIRHDLIEGWMDQWTNGSMDGWIKASLSIVLFIVKIFFLLLPKLTCIKVSSERGEKSAFWLWWEIYIEGSPLNNHVKAFFSAVFSVRSPAKRIFSIVP